MARDSFNTRRSARRRILPRTNRSRPRHPSATRSYIVIAAVVAVIVALVALVIIRPWSTTESDTLDEVATTADRLAVEDVVTVDYTTNAGTFTGSLDTRGRVIGEFTTDSTSEPVSALVVSTGADVFAEGGPPLWEAAGMGGDFVGWVNVNDASLIPAALDPSLAQVAHAARTQDANVNAGGITSLRGFTVQVLDNGDEGGTPKLKISRGSVVATVTGGGDMANVDDLLAAAGGTPARVVSGDDGALRVDGPSPRR
ncbi:hypothetical protein [Corynebacterium sp. AOP12-C2-36]|uniref:hypothetical protein n=1 Tax=Corynebacterium sp. AOP12-C2-36 TaxID=3457723 RepID=UPI004033696D